MIAKLFVVMLIYVCMAARPRKIQTLTTCLREHQLDVFEKQPYNYCVKQIYAAERTVAMLSEKNYAIFEER